MDRRIFLKSTLTLPFVRPMQTVLANGRESASAVGKTPQLVHLRVHAEYSLCDGIVRVPHLMGRVASAAMPAVALTDQSNLFGVVQFYKEAQAAGIKPVIGRKDNKSVTPIAASYDNGYCYRIMEKSVW